MNANCRVVALTVAIVGFFSVTGLAGPVELGSPYADTLEWTVSWGAGMSGCVYGMLQSAEGATILTPRSALEEEAFRIKTGCVVGTFAGIIPTIQLTGWFISQGPLVPSQDEIVRLALGTFGGQLAGGVLSFAISNLFRLSLAEDAALFAITTTITGTTGATWTYHARPLVNNEWLEQF